LNLTMAHQYIGQINPKIYQAVLGNTGSIIAFRVGGEDATRLKSEFDPLFGVKDMINLAVGEFYIKMTIDGESYDPFSAETLRVLPPTHRSYRKEIMDASRRQFAIRREDAAKLIEQEESTIIRSAEEKAMIQGGGRTGEDDENDKNNKDNKPEVKATQEAEPMI